MGDCGWVSSLVMPVGADDGKHLPKSILTIGRSTTHQR